MSRSVRGIDAKRRLDLARAWQNVAATEDGAFVIAELLRFCGWGEEIPPVQPPGAAIDPLAVMRRAGRIDVAVRVNALITDDLMKLLNTIDARSTRP